MKRFGIFAILLVLHQFVPQASAQNISGYSMIPEPFLFLLREPAVQEDLGLDAPQRQLLVQINESYDGILLASRNMNPQEGQKQIAEVNAKTREQVTDLFSKEQQERLRQITYRVRGISFVLLPEATERLELSQKQIKEIETIIEETFEQINQVQSTTYQGAQAHETAQQAFVAARKKEQEQILAVLEDQQKRTLLDLVGPKFDLSSLGRVSFKAPELSAGDQWINSEALKLTDLRGKVVALHFWAFG